MQMSTLSAIEFDVIIIGGGITGLGTARDCSLRGLKVLLVERFDFASGATGRNHGLLHSGARYAVTDHESAAECIKENMILRKIAKHCVEENDGFFITLPEDDLAFQSTFVDSCKSAGINAEVFDPKEALRMEPAINPSIIGAVKVPDGSVDPFRLSMANAIDAQNHGARILIQHEVMGFIIEQGVVKGVTLYDHLSKTKFNVYAKITVNASGVWGHNVAKMAGVNINMFPAKGALLIFGHRVNNIVINRCRKPADADILVPGDTISLIGTTSSHVSYDEVDNMRVTQEEVDILLREGSKLAPSLATTRILRAYAGVRPLVAADNDPTGRSISRGIVLLDHKTRDGLDGFITITGGKLMTYRLMAEWATDLVCKKLGLNAQCTTAAKVLPGTGDSVYPEISEQQKVYFDNSPAYKSAKYRHGSLSANINLDNTYSNSLICECEGVSVGEVEYAINDLHVDNLSNLRRRTRVGMGTCQGELCACRAAGLLAKSHKCTKKAKNDLAEFLNERWKGMYPITWGETLSEIQLSSWMYEGVMGLTAPTHNVETSEKEEIKK